MATKNEYKKRLSDFEAFDRIDMRVVPRFKTSGLSGDEWRTSVQVDFYFKAVLVHTVYYHDMQKALMMTPHEWIMQRNPIPAKALAIEGERCDQPGCSKPHNGAKRYLRRETSAQGEYLDRAETYHILFRRFCAEHADRGYQSREDCEDNYADTPEE
jgi:hypothetical protein